MKTLRTVKSRRRGTPAALLSGLILATALLGAGSATAHQQHKQQHGHSSVWHHPTPAWSSPVSDQALALNWFDVTQQTVAAAGFPEPVTQSRTWAVELDRRRPRRPGRSRSAVPGDRLRDRPA